MSVDDTSSDRVSNKFIDYIESSSFWGVMAFLVCACLIQVFSVAGSIVLRSWGEANNNGEAHDFKCKYLIITNVLLVTS